MKKIVATLLIIFFFTNSIVSYAFSSTKIVDRPLARFIINGVGAPIKEMPVLINQKLYLTIKSLAVNLGIKDNANSIIIDTPQKTYTLVKDKTKLVMKLDDKKIQVNGGSDSLDGAPVLYRNLVYVPADSVAKVFGQRAIWDDASGGIAISTITSFNKVKETIEKITKTLNTTKYKGTQKLTQQVGTNSKRSVTFTSETDRAKGIEHSFTEQNLNGGITKEERYVTDQFLYSKLNLNDTWVKTATGNPGNSGNVTFLGKGTEFLYAGLVIKAGSSDNDILEGDIEVNPPYVDPNINGTYQPHLKITYNKSNYFPNEMIWKSNGVTKVDNKVTPYSISQTFNYTGFQGNFAVKLPAELKKVKETVAYENSLHNYILYYPKGWGVNSSTASSYVTFYSPLENKTDQFQENITFAMLDSKQMSLDQFSKAILDQYKNSYSDFKIITSVEGKLGGEKSQKVVTTYTLQGKKVKSIQTWAIYGTTAYFISFASAVDKFDSYSGYMNDLIKTFIIQ